MSMASRQPVMDDLENLLVRTGEAYVGGRPLDNLQYESTQIVCQMLSALALLDAADQMDAMNSHLAELTVHLARRK